MKVNVMYMYSKCNINICIHKRTIVNIIKLHEIVPMRIEKRHININIKLK